MLKRLFQHPARGGARGGSRRATSLGVLGSLAFALTVHCGFANPSSADDPTGQTASAIIHGDASSPAQNFVVEIVHPVGDGAFVCSGSLIAPNLVLTARHCIATTPEEGFSCDESGNGTDGGTIGAEYDPTEVFIYVGTVTPGPYTQPDAHGVRFFHDDATNICNHDLALIELDTALTNVPLATLDLDTKLAAGDTITAVGWGVTADGAAPAVRLERGDIPIIAVGPANDPTGYTVASSEFDVGESICVGDSGGPALNKASAVVGVVSRGGNNVMSASANDAVTCVGPSTVNLYTETAPFRDLILSAFASVGASPVRVSVPLGEACANASECSSGTCETVVADAGTVCTQSCATSGCPSGFRCDTASGKSLCEVAPDGSGCTVARDGDRQGGAWGSLLALGLFAGIRASRRGRRGRSSRRRVGRTVA